MQPLTHHEGARPKDDHQLAGGEPQHLASPTRITGRRREGKRNPAFQPAPGRRWKPSKPRTFLGESAPSGITPPGAAGERAAGRVEVGPTGQARAPPVQGIKPRRSWLRLRVDATEARRRGGSPAAREEEEGKFGPLYGLDDGLRFYLAQ